MPRTLLPCFVLLLAALLHGCETVGDLRCGFGTTALGDECVSVSSCGAGTELVDGECTASGSNACGPGTLLGDDGETCVLDSSVCPAPSQLDTATGDCTAVTSVSCGDGTELLGNVCVPSCDGEFETPNRQRNGCDPAARIQFFHGSPDPTIATVDLYVDGVLAGDGLGDNIDFTFATPTIKVREGARLRAAVGSSSSDASFLDEATVPASQESYLVVLRGVAGSGFDTSVNDTSLSLDLIPGLQERSGTGANAAVFPLVQDAGPLDIALRGPEARYETEAFTNDVGFSSLGAYGGLETSQAVVLDVLDGEEVVASFLAPELVVGDSVVFALTGFLDPGSNRGSSGRLSVPLQATVLNPVAGAAALQHAPRGQIVHAASAGPVTTTVQAIGGAIAPLTPSLSFGNASARFGLLPVDQQLNVLSGGLVLASAREEPSAGESLRFLLIGDASRTDDRSPNVLPIDDLSDGLERDTGDITLQFVHAAADATSRYDVHISNAGAVSLTSAEFSDVGYGEAGDGSAEQSRSATVVSLTLPGSTSVALVEFDIDLSAVALDSAGALLVLTGDDSTPASLQLSVFARATTATQVTGGVP